MYDYGNEWVKLFLGESITNLQNDKPVAIKKVGFYDPVTVVFWEDGTKTVVKAENEAFDKEKGLAMAIAKKYFGNTGSYWNVFKQWIKED